MTIPGVTSQPTDAERFSHILQVQRASYLRDGAPSLAARRRDLKNLKAALIARRSAIEEAINTDFGNRSRHETAMMELVGVVQGIDYLERNLRRFMRPSRRHIAPLLRFGANRIEYQPLGATMAQTSARSSTARPPATSPSTAPSCTSRRTTFPSAASARAGWANTTGLRASER